MGPTETERLLTASQDQEPVAEALAALGAPVSELRRRVEGLPLGLTDRHLLGLLEEHGILRSGTVQRFLELRHRSLYARESIDQRDAVAISAQLRLEIERADRSSVQSLLETFLPEAERARNLESSTETENASYGFETEPQRVESTRIETKEELRPARPKLPTRSWALFGILLFLLGFASQEWGPRVVDRIGERSRDMSPEEANLMRLTAIRRGLAKNPDSLARLTDLANFALRAGQEENAVLALQRIVAIDPENVRGLNGLAWIHATSLEPLIKDPARALVFAERAYALSQEPRITDTLAEAAFLNGDIERAILLEQDALARVRGNADHYRRQLARYQAASKAAPGQDAR